MLVDKRIEKLAYGLVNYSCALKKGENLLIESTGADYQLINAIIKEAYKVGANVLYTINDSRIKREMLKGLTEEQVQLMTKIDVFKMERMDAYIGIRGGNNSYELADVPAEKMSLYNSIYAQNVHHNIRVDKTKWVILRYPTEGMAELSSMSTEAFEDFYFDVCNLNYANMDKAMDPLVELMNKTDKVRIIHPNGTNLNFSIKNIGAVKCSGLRNIPDGEVYSAPVKESVNGVIMYNAPTVYNGVKHENVKLVFKNGKIIEATSNKTKELNDVLNSDEGARYVGEFAIGVNPFVKDPMCDILFDEKISGSIHFTPGACYEDAYNGNKSSVHWDLVLIQTEEYGGGEIYFDDVLIRKNGIFVLDELKCLNPEFLK